MTREVLFAVDGSSNCLQAAAGLAQLLSGQPDYRFLLFHCASQPSALRPGELWAAADSTGIGRSLRSEETAAFFAPTLSILQENGIPGDRIATAIRHDSLDPGSEILETARQAKIQTIAVGRRGRSSSQDVLIGNVSSRVAQYCENRAVWVIDAAMNRTRKCLIAVEGAPECRVLTYYAAEWLAATPDLSFSFVHLLPPVPPTFWDDGHILDAEELLERERDRQKWRAEWLRQVEKFMDEARDALVHGGVPADRIETRIENVREGVSRDLLAELERGKYQLLLAGKRSFRQKKPFLMGSNANKMLHYATGATICLVDAR